MRLRYSHPARRNTLWLFFLIAVIASLAYANTLRNSFVRDDFIVIVNNDFVKSWSNFPLVFSKAYLTPVSALKYPKLHNQGSGEHSYRPLVTISYFIDYSIWKLRARGYHLTNLILHIINSLLLYCLIISLTQNNKIAALSALFFALHPVNTEAVNAISFREDLLAFLFFTLSFILFVKWQALKRPLRPILYFLSCASFALALFSKEMAVTLPLIVMLYDFLFSPQDNEKSEFMPLKPRYLGYFLVLALYLWVRLFLMRNPGVTEAAYPGGNLYTNILTMCKVFASYAQWIIFPLNIHLTLPDDPALISRSLFEPAALFSIALIIFMLALAFRLRKTARAVSFAILWFFITLLPVSNILPLANYMASRYLYIPLVGFCLLSSVILVNLPELKIFAFRPQALRRAARNTAVILILSYGAITIIKNMSWKNDTVFWMEMVENYPANALAHSNLANQFGKSGLFREAIREYAIALKLDPRYAMDYNSLGSCYYAIGMPDEALKYFNKALELDPRLPDAITNLGVISGDRGLYREAIKYFEAAIRADPRFIPAYNNLGITYAKMGENQKAQKIWGQALKIIPDSQEVQENLRKLRMAGH